MNEEICGTCKYNSYDKDDKRFYCDNEDSDTYGTPNNYDDGCENWEEKQMNEIEKTINRLKRMLHHNESQQACDAINAAISALEKQIPKKPNYSLILKIMHCDCGARLLPGQNYCSYCSHAIDWSVEE